MIHRKAKVKDFDDCGQKKFYPSKQMAWKDAALQNIESFGNVVKKPYKCTFCHGYHLTSIA